MKNIAWIFVAALFMAACNFSDSIEELRGTDAGTPVDIPVLPAFDSSYYVNSSRLDF